MTDLTIQFGAGVDFKSWAIRQPEPPRKQELVQAARERISQSGGAEALLALQAWNALKPEDIITYLSKQKLQTVPEYSHQDLLLGIYTHTKDPEIQKAALLGALAQRDPEFRIAKFISSGLPLRDAVSMLSDLGNPRETVMNTLATSVAVTEHLSPQDEDVLRDILAQAETLPPSAGFFDRLGPSWQPFKDSLIRSLLSTPNPGLQAYALVGRIGLSNPEDKSHFWKKVGGRFVLNPDSQRNPDDVDLPIPAVRNLPKGSLSDEELRFLAGFAPGGPETRQEQVSTLLAQHDFWPKEWDETGTRPELSKAADGWKYDEELRARTLLKSDGVPKEKRVQQAQDFLLSNNPTVRWVGWKILQADAPATTSRSPDWRWLTQHTNETFTDLESYQAADAVIQWAQSEPARALEALVLAEALPPRVSDIVLSSYFSERHVFKGLHFETRSPLWYQIPENERSLARAQLIRLYQRTRSRDQRFRIQHFLENGPYWID